MPDPVTAVIAGGISAGGSIIAGNRAADAAGDAADASAATAARAGALNRERFALAQGYLDPYVGRANIAAQQLQAEMGLPQYGGSSGGFSMDADKARMSEIDALMSGMSPTISVGGGRVSNPEEVRDDERGAQRRRNRGGVAAARASEANPEYDELSREREEIQARIGTPYMYEPQREYKARSMSEIPGFQAVMDESLGAAEQSAMSSGSTLYGGRRLEAAGKVGAGVQQSYYNNYMNLLQNMANPAVATNLAGMGVGQAQSIGQQNIAATGMANDYRMQGVGAQNAAFSDLMGGAVQLGSGYMMGGGMTPAPTPGVWV